MSDQKQSEAPAENTTSVEMVPEELETVVGGLAQPHVHPVQPSSAGQQSVPGQQKGIIAILIG